MIRLLKAYENNSRSFKCNIDLVEVF